MGELDLTNCGVQLRPSYQQLFGSVDGGNSGVPFYAGLMHSNAFSVYQSFMRGYGLLTENDCRSTSSQFDFIEVVDRGEEDRRVERHSNEFHLIVDSTADTTMNSSNLKRRRQLSNEKTTNDHENNDHDESKYNNKPSIDF
jgi:hypothetical protein